MAFPIYRRNVILSLFSHYNFDPQHIHASRVLVSLTISLYSLTLLHSLFLSFGSSPLRLLIQTEDTWSFTWISDFNTNYRIKFTSTVLLRVAIQHFPQHTETPHFANTYDYQKTQQFFPYTTLTYSQNSNVSIMTGLRDGRSRNRGSILNRGERFFPFMKISDRLCCPQYLKRMEREDQQIPTSSTTVKNEWKNASTTVKLQICHYPKDIKRLVFRHFHATSTDIFFDTQC